MSHNYIHIVCEPSPARDLLVYLQTGQNGYNLLKYTPQLVGFEDLLRYQKRDSYRDGCQCHHHSQLPEV